MPDPRIYYEARRLGIWWPRTAAQEPQVKTIDGRMFEARSDGTIGPEICAVCRINVGHAHLNLQSLREVYGPEGRFYNARELQDV